MDRREFISGSGATVATGPQLLRSAFGQDQAGRFDTQQVRQHARVLASKPYGQPNTPLPAPFKDLKYDAYRDIRFRPERALWRGENLPFEVQFFHRGFIFQDRVDIYVVSNGRADLIAYSADLFSFGKLAPKVSTDDVGFSGFRLHAKLNRPDYYDEFAVFLGASYFRAVAKGQNYGLSARGLSVRTGDPKGEEFPRFTTFWIEKPAPEATSIVVHALLDSESAAAAYRFTIRPGESTIFDTELVLYPRTDIAEPGIAPSNSMFLFDANDRVGVDDFRPAAHDSDGLAIRTGREEEIWRPLNNPKDLQVSVFSDQNPRGFGLMQRERHFFAYDDLESHFEKRPSLWIEPIGDWGRGGVYLLEIPTREEIHDNIVAFWRPKDILKAKGEYSLTYRLHWTNVSPIQRKLARFTKLRVGAGPSGTRLFILEVEGQNLSVLDPNDVQATVTADKGNIGNLVLQRNTDTGGVRLSFDLDTKNESSIELRTFLKRADTALSETWLYRWTR